MRWGHDPPYNHGMQSRWAAIVGWSKDGRGELTDHVLSGLRSRGVRLAGCRQERLVDERGEISGYDLVDLANDERHALARASDDPILCNWGFDERVFARVRERVLADPAPIVFLEVGPLEARGRGHWETIEQVLASPDRVLLLGIRPRALARIALDLPDPLAGLETPAGEVEVHAFLDTLVGSELVSARSRV